MAIFSTFFQSLLVNSCIIFSWMFFFFFHSSSLSLTVLFKPIKNRLFVYFELVVTVFVNLSLIAELQMVEPTLHLHLATPLHHCSPSSIFRLLFGWFTEVSKLLVITRERGRIPMSWSAYGNEAARFITSAAHTE